MIRHLLANLWLLVVTLVLCCVVYPLIILGIGQALFPHQAEGSLLTVKGSDGKEVVVGSELIAQPFTADEYFQPRPSAASYNGAASGASNWGANNYLLRDRVARALGPIVKYQGPASKKGQPVGPDVEAWFQKDSFQGKPGIVAQWADAHSTVAQNWVKADKLNGEYVAAWQKEHQAEVDEWIKANPGTPEPKPEDLAVPFFESYSKSFPGTFPSIVEHKTGEGADAKTEKKVEPVKEGTDIQAGFFDMWLQEDLWLHEQDSQGHPLADLEKVPADMVMASGSGLDPHITLKNALYQLDRVAGKWAEKTTDKWADKSDGEKDKIKGKIAEEIKDLLNKKAGSPLLGLAGVPMVNVLEVNLALKDLYGPHVVEATP
jgi:K+-transporting ATPase ATPase C chain